jgi:hypothetical protein
MMIDIHSIAKAYGGDVCGNTATVPTPGHSPKDRGTVITISPDAPDGLVIHSFNGGNPLAMKDQLRRDGLMPEWKPKETKMRFGPSTQTPAAPFQPTSVFEYFTIDGHNRYNKVRTDRADGNKTFMYKHQVNGVWTNGRGGDALLYRLLDIVAKPDAVVYMAEGERKADKLAHWGLLATSSKDLPNDLSAYMRGRTVVILPDNDKQGADIADKALKALKEVGAHAFIVKLPRLPAKGDIIDWDGNAAELAELAKRAFNGGAKTTTKHKYQTGISASALMQKTFAEIRYIIPGYVAEGLTLLAGAPKVGKSWMTLGWALSVAGERPTFGSICPDGGDVLYLALEDNERRLQKRLKQMAVGAVPDRLTLITEWPSLDEGCVEQIAHWIAGVPKPRMVIVDVLARVRGAVAGKETAYDGDYRLISGLQRLAGQHGIAIVMVHHTRKMDADDPFDAVSGTRGLTGAADTVLVLKADTGTGQMMLYGRGRDIEEIETCVRFEADNGTWNIVGPAHEIARSDERQPILDLLRKANKPLSPIEISEITGRKRDTIRKTMMRMAVAGEITKFSRGLYWCHTCHIVPSIDPSGQTDTCDTVYNKEPKL